jgi:hypothetical protein
LTKPCLGARAERVEVGRRQWPSPSLPAIMWRR